MQFSEIMAGVQRTAEGWCAVISEDWLQGRSVFGGMQIALVAKAMRELLPDVPLRSLQVTFMAPVPAGSMQMRAAILRRGKSATHVEARIVDGAQTLCIAIAIYGASRPSQVERVLQQSAIEVSKPKQLPYIAGLTPPFTQHFDIQWLSGGLPYSGTTLTAAVLHLGFKHETGQADIPHILALADVIPPLGLSLLKKPAAGSSMTWTFEMLTDQLDGLPLQGWRMDAEMIAAKDGYTSQAGILWAPDGRAIALSRQNMVIFG